MRYFYSIAILSIIFHSCDIKPDKNNVPDLTNNITIFEVYLKDSGTLDDFSLFIKDTLGLPVEWNNFDLFGDGVVYDEAFFLGNTTFELVTLFQGDSTMKEKARFNRIIFGTDDIEALSSTIEDDFQHEIPADFNIVSGGEKISMGKQTTLDSLSKSSNFYVSFWQYFTAGLSFKDRSVNATSVEELYQKLGSMLKSNPLGIIELKEVHLSMTDDVLDQWQKLLGPSTDDHWKLSKGPIISHTIASTGKGIDWISIKVKNLAEARNYLKSKDLLSESNGKVSINRANDYGLQIFLEE
jgi:hypothetical protein